MSHVPKSGGWQTRGENGKALKATLRFLTPLLAQLRILNWGWAYGRHLVLSWLEWRGDVVGPLVGRGHLGLNILQCTGQTPHNKNYEAQNVSNAGFRKSWPNWMDSSALSGKVLSILQSATQLFRRASLNYLLLTSQESMPWIKQLLFTRHLAKGFR